MHRQDGAWHLRQREASLVFPRSAGHTPMGTTRVGIAASSGMQIADHDSGAANSNHLPGLTIHDSPPCVRAVFQRVFRTRAFHVVEPDRHGNMGWCSEQLDGGAPRAVATHFPANHISIVLSRRPIPPIITHRSPNIVVVYLQAATAFACAGIKPEVKIRAETRLARAPAGARIRIRSL